MSNIKVLLVEDDNLTRSTLALSLGALGFEVPGPSSSLVEAVESFHQHRQDVLVADLDLGIGPNGIELAHLLRASYPKLGVVFITSFEDPRLQSESQIRLPAGSKYLVKQSLLDASEIGKAIELAISARLNPFSETDAPFLERFTTVQLSTMQLIAKGLSNSEIAKQRSVSLKAVEKTINKIATGLQLAPDSTTNLRVSIARAYLKLTGGKA